MIKHGLGTINYLNGSVYEGMWVMGMREGYGRLIHPNGDMYEGDWMNDKANGQGTFSNMQGYVYEGTWVDDCQHGTGCERWESNNSKYEGTFENSKKNGFGRYEWADGSYYEGTFADGVFDGEGTYFFADLQKTYIGQFKNANMDGVGTEVWLDGKTFTGFYVLGRKQGEGTMTYPNKKQYRGPWEKNQKHGVGIELNLKVNTQRVGEWRRGKWVRWLSATQKVDPDTGMVLPSGSQRSMNFNESAIVKNSAHFMTLDQSSIVNQSNQNALNQNTLGLDSMIRECSSRNEMTRTHTLTGKNNALPAPICDTLSDNNIKAKRLKSSELRKCKSPQSMNEFNVSSPVMNKDDVTRVLKESVSKSQKS